jgi:hypothetical protein
MKKLITFLSICTTVAILALPVAASNLIAQPNNFAQDACTQEAKDALYQSFLKNRQADQAKAYGDAKKYLACPPGEVTEASQKIIDYLKKWSKAYEDGMKKIRFRELLYKEKKYPEAYALGKEILAAEPDNTMVIVHMGANGYLVAGNPSLAAESLDYAKKSLQALDSGKTITDWEELGSKEAAVAYLNFTTGALTVEKDPANALKPLIKSVQFETPLKKSPYPYAYIAGAYETGPYAKQSEAYKACCSGKEETPESKLALANINQIVDRMIDGYARAVALAGTDAAYAAKKTEWNDRLTEWYKFRYASDTTLAGLKDLIAGILSKPLPPEPTPLTSLPPSSTPAATPANTSGTPSGNGNGTASTGTPATATPANKTTTTTPANKTTTTPAAGTKPAPKPDRPRNRR